MKNESGNPQLLIEPLQVYRAFGWHEAIAWNLSNLVTWFTGAARFLDTPSIAISTLIQCVLRAATSVDFILFPAHSENLVQKALDQASNKKFANSTRAETAFINAYKIAVPKSIESRVIRAILVDAIPVDDTRR